MLQAFDGTHVLRALKGLRVRAAELAHAALHLLNGFVVVTLHPLDDALLYGLQVFDAISQQSRTHHGHVSAGHQQLDDIWRTMDAARTG
jgi:hypothetical protein